MIVAQGLQWFERPTITIASVPSRHATDEVAAAELGSRHGGAARAANAAAGRLATCPKVRSVKNLGDRRKNCSHGKRSAGNLTSAGGVRWMRSPATRHRGRPMSVVCPCPSSALCALCRSRLLEQLSGAADARGYRWAMAVATKVSFSTPWPAFEGKCAEIARRKVVDLTSDPILREHLAERAAAAAAGEWNRLSLCTASRIAASPRELRKDSPAVIFRRQCDFRETVSPSASAERPPLHRAKLRGSKGAAMFAKKRFLILAGLALICCVDNEDGNAVENADVPFRSIQNARIQKGDIQDASPNRNILNVDYSRYLGGGGIDEAYAVGADSQGNAYVAGITPTACGSSRYIYVAKLSPSGANLYYACLFPGSYVNSIAIDSSGNAFVAAGNILSKLDSTGTSFVYSSSFGSWRLYSVTIDPLGNAYVAGSTVVAGKLSEAVVAKVNPSGTALLYAVNFGGTKDDYGSGVAIDNSGNAYVTGRTYSLDFPISRPFQSTLRGGADCFVAQLNPTGTQLLYSTYLGGYDYDSGSGIAADGSGNTWLVGTTYSWDLPVTSNAAQYYRPGEFDAFISKFSATGSQVYTTYLGGSGREFGDAIAVDKSTGTAYIVGQTQSVNFPIAGSVFQARFKGQVDAFLTQVHPTGGSFAYSTYLGGSTVDIGLGVALDPQRNAYATGVTLSSDFPTTFSAHNGGQDAFVTRFRGP